MLGKDRIPHVDTHRSEESNKAIVTVLGSDRVGIVAAVASALAAHDVNILDISQTLFGELFTMNMLVDLKSCRANFGVLKDDLESVGRSMGIQVIIQREDVFRFMHRV